jgi:cytochrome P450
LDIGLTKSSLYDLAVQPELVEALRAEIRDVLKEHHGIFSMAALQHLKLLDSVMKESTRLNPLSLSGFVRVAIKPVTFKDGVRIPAGATIEVPKAMISHDPEYFPNPDVFDPYRFYNGRKEDEEAMKRRQFVSVTKQDLTFGFGRHACPGRFFAAVEIKIIVANILLRYDIKLKDESTKRFDSVTVGATVSLSSYYATEAYFLRIVLCANGHE